MSLNESQQILAEMAARHAKPITDKYKKKIPHLDDDIESAAGWGAIRAANTYKDGGGSSWERWSNRIIKHEIVKTVQQECERIKELSHFMELKQPTVHHEDPPGGALAVTPDMILSLIDNLEDQEYVLCDLVYRKGHTLTTAAVAMAIGKSYATKLHQRAITKMKCMMND